MILKICVRSKSNPGHHHFVSYDTDCGQVRCSCSDFDDIYCAHIDAPLRAGERGMVFEQDHETADRIMAMMPPIEPPVGWKASWQRNKAWRGLPTRKRAAPTKSTRHAALGISEEDMLRRPCVVFTGTFSVSRNELVAQAEQHGWRAAGMINFQTRALVVGEKAGGRKLRAAEAAGVEILSLASWSERISG
ncbi:MAG: hypothetical protein BGP16_05455 [Sphingobium sp. 66-54]|nr:MAG: hypothetical protein BGP16_05455 [Sphingobium sp. 66-54]